MLAKLIASALRKTQIIEFLGLPSNTPEAKALLVAQLQHLIEVDPDAQVRLLDTFPCELAVGPTEAQRQLGCSAIERRRWIKEGKLPVLEYRTLREGHREVQYAVHDRRLLLKLLPEEIARWREEHQKRVREQRKVATHIAVQHKRLNGLQRQNFQTCWQQTITEWAQLGSSELALVLQLCFWTVWSARWTNENHLKYLRSTRYMDIYAAHRDAWRHRKYQAIRLLACTPYAHLSYYRPLDADKCFLTFCQKHEALKQAEYYVDDRTFFADHISTIRQCSRCIIHEEKDYYALYIIEIAPAVLPAVHFSYHVPYPIGKSWLPAPEKLPIVEDIEQDAFFALGRPLQDCEKIVHREKDVLAHFEQVLTAAHQHFDQMVRITQKTQQT